MQNFSKYFNLDTVDSNQTLKPVLLITDIDDNVLFTLTLDQDELFNNIGESVDIISCISKVSNVKISNDFDTKNIKINRLRCALYNYYDLKHKLSDYVNTGIINKNIYLFYKSPTTNVINLTDTISDYDCALIFAGEISRIKFNEKTIDITAEDKTQIKMGDKKVPHLRLDKMELPIQESVSSRYKQDNAVVPMTFGQVDKAPVLPYLMPENSKYLKILLDVQPTASTFQTARIPSLLDSTPLGASNFYLYVKESDDYLILEHQANTINRQNELFSNLTLQSFAGATTNYVLPNIINQEEEVSVFKNWQLAAYSQRLAISITTLGSGVSTFSSSMEGILKLTDTPADEIESFEHTNPEKIIDNNNLPKKWFRDGDSDISSGDVNFHMSAETYTGTNANVSEGQGRYIILRIEDAVGDTLINLGYSGNWLGNTFLAADWQVFASSPYDDASANDLSDVYYHGSDPVVYCGYFPNADRHGFYVAPIVDHWKNIARRTSNGTDDFGYVFGFGEWDIEGVSYQSIPTINRGLGYILASTEEQIDMIYNNAINPPNFNESHIANDSGSLDESNPMGECPMFCTIDKGYRTNNKFWGSRGVFADSDNTGWRTINGLTYGFKGSPDKITIPQQNFNDIGIFEYRSAIEGVYANRVKVKQGLELNNFALVQSVLVDDITEKNIYASIVGRKNHLFTEQLNPENYTIGGEQIDLTLEQYWLGNETDTNLSSDILLQTFYEMVYNTANTLIPIESAGAIVDYNYDSIGNFFRTESYGTVLSTVFTDLTQNQHTSAFWNTFSFLKDYIFRAYLFPVEHMHYGGALLRGAASGVYEVTPYDHQTTYSPSSTGFDTEVTVSWRTFEINRDPLIETSVNYIAMFNENWAKTFGKAVYQYLFQDGNWGGDFDDNWSFEYKYPTFTNAYLLGTYWHSPSDEQAMLDYGNEGFQMHRRLEDHSAPNGFSMPITEYSTTFNLTDSINSKRQYSWDSFEINTIEDLLNNFYVYMDDLQQAIYESLNEANLPYSNYVPTATPSQSSIVSASDFGISELSQFDEEIPLVFTNAGSTPDYIEQGISTLEGSTNTLDLAQYDLYSVAYGYYLGESGYSFTTDGIIEKPSDIVMNILVNEMSFGRLNDNIDDANYLIGIPDYDKFDLVSIQKSRDAHSFWKLGFSIDKEFGGKKLIENILQETKSYPRFTNNGKFGLVTIKEQYSYDDINMFIDTNDIIKYKFTQSKREDIVTSINAGFRYDNGQNRYLKYKNIDISDIFDSYATTAFDNYNLLPEDTHKEMELRYHSHIETVDDFLKYTLANNCNPHNIIDFTLPLNYLELSVGDIIHIPLINNEKAFNVDYGIVDYVNSQPIYPLWIVMSTDVGLNGIKINAVQLHYLKGDGMHGFTFPDQTQYDIIGNMKEFNSTYTYPDGSYIRNWNYNPNATIDSGVEIPYFDLNGDGNIDINDLNLLINYLSQGTVLTESQKSRLKYENSNIDATTVVALVNIIVG